MRDPGRSLLIALGVLGFAGFALQRARSPFLAIERERALAQELAPQTGLRVAELMALRELCGVARSRDELLAVATAFADERARLGEALAVCAANGRATLVAELLAACGGDAVAATARLRELPEGIDAVRFAAMRDRFAARGAP